MLWSLVLWTLVVPVVGDTVANQGNSPNTPGQEKNPCTNGSFERLDGQHFALDWAPVGRIVEMTQEARTGQWAVQLTRTADTPQNIETGLNRTKLIDRIQGGMEFWYKAISADSAQLRIMVIPVGQDGREDTGSPRAEYIIPRYHIGDGQWHRARIRYDYTDNPKVKQVHFAARITGNGGQLLLDDIAYLERTGPIVSIRRLRWQEDPQQPGEKAVLSVKLENTGDAPTQPLEVTVQAQRGLRVSGSLNQTAPETSPGSSISKQNFSPEKAQKEPGGKEAERPASAGQPKVIVPALGPSESIWVHWTVEGKRTKPGLLEVRVVAGEVELVHRLEIAPEMVLRSFGPTAPVAIAGRPIRLECVVENPGRAILEGAQGEVQLSIPGKTEQKKVVFPPIRPGRWETQAVGFTPVEPTASANLKLLLRAAGQPSVEAASDVLVLTDRPLPPPAGRLHAKASEHWAVLENRYLRLVFPRSAAGFGPAQLQVRNLSAGVSPEPPTNSAGFGPAQLLVRKPSGSAPAVQDNPAEQTGQFIPVGWLTPLSRLVWQTESGQQQSETIFADQPPKAELLPAKPEAAQNHTEPNQSGPKVDQIARLVFSWVKTDAQGARWQLDATFSLGPEDRLVQVEYRLQCDRPRKLLHFQGPVLSVLQRREAVFPGLEWLVDDEISSSSLDIAQDHPHRVRRVVHPQMITIPAIGLDTGQGVVGLLWDNRPRPDRPAVVCDWPDRVHHRRSHLVGLFLPPVPEYVEVNELVARRPYPVEPGKPLHIQCQLYADGAAPDVLAVVEQWIGRYGLPEPTPLPHQSYQQEIAFSMQAYLYSLWDPESKKWWTTKGGGMMSEQGRPAAFVADLLLGELISPDRALAAQCRQR
ncbi:MAG: hypothetical protein NZ602_05290, partial [Thermoguttaceae bacterium]|nr:hypothetical protein [Thermoguttaceae bacterium]